MKEIKSGKNVIKAWIDGVSVEEKAMKQLINLSNMPFIYKHIAVMPDVHYGMGATVGSVIATNKAIIPSAVGVDIGCGMMAVKTPLIASDLPDNLFELRSLIERSIPHGRTNNGQEGDKGSWTEFPPRFISSIVKLVRDYENIINKHRIIEQKKEPWYQLGTLGTGNHFIEICIDENQSVWVMLHSGSRGIGNKIGSYFIDKAKEEMYRWHIDKFIPDIDLSYLVENTTLYDDYIFSVEWAQKFAYENRNIMINIVMNILLFNFPEQFSRSIIAEPEWAINCHHNYVSKENHFGKNVLVTRKGAVRARKNDLGIIPGSMGSRSFIVRGKGNPESFNSCSHGAGRIMSRSEAKKKFTLEDHIKSTEGVECRKDNEVIDETPLAYKDIDAVMNAQSDLVEIVHTLKQVICIKG